MDGLKLPVEPRSDHLTEDRTEDRILKSRLITQSIRGSDAGELFEVEVRRYWPSYEVAQDDASAIFQLLHLLGGNPLWITLAAAQRGAAADHRTVDVLPEVV